ncbi:MAG: DUF1573 domain-containing protein, partial [Planctomycetota bacterium]
MLRLSLVLCIFTASTDASPVPVTARPAADERSEALNVLSRLAIHGLDVRSEVTGLELAGRADLPVPASWTVSALVEAARDGRGAAYRQRSHSAVRGAQFADISWLGHLSSEREDPLPRAALYWSGALGLRVLTENADIGITRKYWGLDEPFWPRELVGYCGITPWAALAQVADAKGELEFSLTPEGRAVLRFPRDTSLDGSLFSGVDRERISYLTIEIAQRRCVRVTSASKAQGAIHELEMHDWIAAPGGVFLPRRADYTLHLAALPDAPADEDRRLTFRVALDHAETARLDGASILALARGFGLIQGASNERYATAAGADAMLLQAARELALDGETLELDAAELVTRNVAQELAAAAAEIAARGALWPGIDADSFQRELLRGREVFDLNESYCTQMCVTVLHLLGGRRVPFEQALRNLPEQRVGVDALVRQLERDGFDYVPVPADVDLAAIAGREPFLVVLGEDEARAHLGVARRRSDAQYMLWSPPVESFFMTPDALRARARLGVYLVPRTWTARHDSLRRTLGLAMLGGAAVFAAAWMLRRRAAATRALATGALVALAWSVSGCARAHGAAAPAAPPADAADAIQRSDRVLIEPVVARPLVSVGLGATDLVQFQVRNVTNETVIVDKGSTSCTCLTFQAPQHKEIAPGALAGIEFRLRGLNVGDNEQRISIVARSGASSHLLTLPVAIHTSAPMYVRPSSPRASGRAGAVAQETFELVVSDVREPDRASLSWQAQRVEVELVELSSQRDRKS